MATIHFFYAKSNHIGVYVVLIIAWIEVRSMMEVEALLSARTGLMERLVAGLLRLWLHHHLSSWAGSSITISFSSVGTVWMPLSCTTIYALDRELRLRASSTVRSLVVGDAGTVPFAPTVRSNNPLRRSIKRGKKIGWTVTSCERIVAQEGVELWLFQIST